jgi:hypothetical protein
MFTKKNSLTTVCIVFLIALSLGLRFFVISANRPVDVSSLSGSDFVYELGGGEERTFRIFVGGALENEGFYTLPCGIFYYELFAALSVGDVSGFNLNSRINPATPMIIVGYCLNVNVAGFNDLCRIMDEASARLIVDYIDENGSIEEKARLKNVLTARQYDDIKNLIYALKV